MVLFQKLDGGMEAMWSARQKDTTRAGDYRVRIQEKTTEPYVLQSAAKVSAALPDFISTKFYCTPCPMSRGNFWPTDKHPGYFLFSWDLTTVSSVKKQPYVLSTLGSI